MTTPREVRQALNNKNLPLDIKKFDSCWYVVNKDGSDMFYSFYDSSLNTFRLDDISLEEIIADIEEKINHPDTTITPVSELINQSNNPNKPIIINWCTLIKIFKKSIDK